MAIHCHVDATATLHGANRGASRSRALHPLLANLSMWALRHDVHLYASHRRGVDNVEPDYLSRLCVTCRARMTA